MARSWAGPGPALVGRRAAIALRRDQTGWPNVLKRSSHGLDSTLIVDTRELCTPAPDPLRALRSRLRLGHGVGWRPTPQRASASLNNPEPGAITGRPAASGAGATHSLHNGLEELFALVCCDERKTKVRWLSPILSRGPVKRNGDLRRVWNTHCDTAWTASHWSATRVRPCLRSMQRHPLITR